MLILALDTALAAATAVVGRDGAVLSVRCEPMARGHQEAIATLAQAAMAAARVGFQDLDRIGVTVGPGSFTGLRVGLAFAKGLALAWDTPLVGVGSLEALAEGLGATGRSAAVIDAGRGHVYRQLFEGGEAQGPPGQVELTAAWAELASFAPRIVVGSGAALVADAAPEARIDPLAYPGPEALIALVGRATAGKAVQPLYLRAPDAKTLAERGVVR